MKENLEKIANKLDIGVSTLYKWKKSRIKLYKFIVEKNDKENSPIENNEILKFYKQLDQEEKELYLAEIKARVLRKKLK